MDKPGHRIPEGVEGLQIFYLCTFHADHGVQRGWESQYPFQVDGYLGIHQSQVYKGQCFNQSFITYRANSIAERAPLVINKQVTVFYHVFYEFFVNLLQGDVLVQV